MRVADFEIETGELPIAAVERVLGDRARLVAVPAASDAFGTRPDVRAITDAAHAAGALAASTVCTRPRTSRPTSWRSSPTYYACFSYRAGRGKTKRQEARCRWSSAEL